MAILTGEIVPGEVSQEQWDGRFDSTTKKIGDMGGATTQTTDDLPEGAVSKYDTGVPPATTDDLSEGASNKYDTGVPPASTDELSEGATNKYDTGTPPTDLDGLPDGTTRKAMSDTEKTKLTGIEEGADANVGEEFSTAEQTKLAGIDAGAEVNPADLAALDPAQNTKLNGIEEDATADQTGAEMRDAVVALADTERKILVTAPETGEFKVVDVHRNAAGNMEYSYDDVPA